VTRRFRLATAPESSERRKTQSVRFVPVPNAYAPAIPLRAKASRWRRLIDRNRREAGPVRLFGGNDNHGLINPELTSKAVCWALFYFKLAADDPGCTLRRRMRDVGASRDPDEFRVLFSRAMIGL